MHVEQEQQQTRAPLPQTCLPARLPAAPRLTLMVCVSDAFWVSRLDSCSRTSRRLTLVVSSLWEGEQGRGRGGRHWVETQQGAPSRGLVQECSKAGAATLSLPKHSPPT